MMTDRPILFSAPMVCALLEGRKTQTRRLLKPQPHSVTASPLGTVMIWNGIAAMLHAHRLPYAPGDRLWVREAFRGDQDYDKYPPREWSHWPVHYEADGYGGADNGRLRPGIHMPRWASRLTLTVTDVRVDRLQDISEADALAEGVTDQDVGGARGVFSRVWNGLHGPDAWAGNPWVVALTFTVDRRNIAEVTL